MWNFTIEAVRFIYFVALLAAVIAVLGSLLRAGELLAAIIDALKSANPPFTPRVVVGLRVRPKNPPTSGGNVQELACAMKTGDVADVELKGKGDNGEFLDKNGEIIYDDVNSPDRVPFVPAIAATSEPQGRAPVEVTGPGKVTIGSDDPGLAQVDVTFGPFPNGSVHQVRVNVAIANDEAGPMEAIVTVRPESPVIENPPPPEGGGGVL